jgi:hypothetical protein
MTEQIILFTLIVLLVALFSYCDAVQDAINFRKSDRTVSMKDVWHFAKFGTRVFLFLLGGCVSKLFQISSFYEIIFWSLALCVLVIWAKYMIWIPIYTNGYKYAVLDETWNFTTGSKWIDNFFGFDKNS